MPQTVQREGVLLQYIVDARLDDMLDAMVRAATRPPLPREPLARAAQIARRYAFMMDTHDVTTSALAERACNKLVAIGPPGSFIHRGAHAAALVHRRPAAPSQGRHARCRRLTARGAGMACSEQRARRARGARVRHAHRRPVRAAPGQRWVPSTKETRPRLGRTRASRKQNSPCPIPSTMIQIRCTTRQ